MIRTFISVLTVCYFLIAVPSPTHAQSIVEPTYDIVIDVGHGGIDGGTSSSDLLEKDINFAIGVKLFHALLHKSYYVGITRIQDYALSDDSSNLLVRSRHIRDLKQRKLIADTLQPKLFISLHVNWSKNKNARGPVVIYQASEASYMLAHTIQTHLNELYGLKKVPQKGDSYFLMKHLEMPSVIVEMGFLSNAKDKDFLSSAHNQELLVEALIRGIGEYFSIYPIHTQRDEVTSSTISDDKNGYSNLISICSLKDIK